MKELPNIDFDGKIVKPNSQGYYKCPYGCGVGSGYPLPKWKTEKGFRQHMEKCSNRPSYVKSKIEKHTNDLELLEKMKTELIPTLPYKIGQKIIYVKEIIVKPTHVQRGNRMVHVRYEEEKRFEAREEELISIDVKYFGSVPSDIYHYILLNRNISPTSLCSTMEEAKIKAIEQQKSYNEYCDFASRCR